MDRRIKFSTNRCRRPAAVLCALLCAVLVSACAGNQSAPPSERSVQDLYNSAVNALVAENYATAARSFDEVERQYPYSIWATKAQLMAGFAHYSANNYDEAIIALNRFIQLHPGNRDVAYAYYLKALCYYEQISDVSRDQLNTERALDSLQDVIRRFPNSKYARDTKLKLDLTRDHLAGKEMDIGRYYLRRDNFLAAINRFRRVINKYQTTTHVPEALHRLAEAYTALGVLDEAQKTAEVLGHNYPGSEWYVDSYGLVTGVDVRKQNEKKETRGMLARAWDWVF